MDAVDPRLREAITQAAADWYARHRAGPLVETQRVAFLEWLKASPLHMEEYLGVAALDRNLAAATEDPSMSVQAWVELARQDAGADVLPWVGARHAAGVTHAGAGGLVRKPWRRWAVAAAIGVGLGLIGFLRRGGVDPARTELVESCRTGHGQQRTWKLPDGSTLHVNTDTVATVRFAPAERVIDVEHGQVAVEVAHDASRPFRVHAGAADAVAVGTNFDVYRLPDAVRITVINGRVAVSVGRFGRAAPPPVFTGAVVSVVGGQQIRIAGNRLPAAANAVDVRETTAWLERKIVFDQRPLAAVAEEFNRYNDGQFSIEDAALRRLPISGSFDAADTESFASFLGSLEGVRVERVASGYRILGVH
jgi:transmembrane sensor